MSIKTPSTAFLALSSLSHLFALIGSSRGRAIQVTGRAVGRYRHQRRALDDCRSWRAGGRGAGSYPHPDGRGPQPGEGAKAEHGPPAAAQPAQQQEETRRRAEGATLKELA